MKLRNVIWIISLTMIALVFAACDTGGDATGGTTGGDANASSAPDLSQTETVDVAELGGSLSVSYPEGWFVSGEGGGFIISNSEEALASSGPDDFDEIPEGTVVVSITMIPGEMASAMGIQGDATPTVILDTFSGFMAGEGMPEFGDVEELTIDGSAAARTSGSDDKMTAALYAIDNEGVFTFGFGATRADEAEANADLIQAIIASATYTPSS